MTDDTTATLAEVDDDRVEDQPGADDDQNDDDLDDDLTGTGDDGDPDEEMEEVEFEGKKYLLPKEVKRGLLREADYTRKTQELAEQRKQVEALQAQVTRADAEILRGHAQLITLDDQLSEYEKTDWTKWRQINRDEADDAWFEYQQMKTERDSLAAGLKDKESRRAFEAQRARAKQIEDAEAELARDIPNWSPELSGKMAEYAHKSLGFTADELNSVADPRIVKLLYEAYQGRQILNKQAVRQKVEQQQTVKTATKVGGTARAPAKLDDRAKTADWIAAREEQLRRRAARGR